MTLVPVSATPTSAGREAEVLTWTYDPWHEHPRVAALAALCALGMCGLVLGLREPFVLAAGLCIFCIASFAPALSPVECRLDPAGVARRGLLGWQRRPWNVIRRVEPLPAGALLSPFSTRRWLDATRSMTLPMPRARRTELLACIERHRETHGG